MRSRYQISGILVIIFVFCLTTFWADLVEARGRGRGGGGLRGGGGFSRGGPAAGGGFSSRSAARHSAREAPRQTPRYGGERETPRSTPKDREDWQEHRDETREDRQEYRDQAREDRQDFIEDEWDDHRYYDEGEAFVTGMAVGAAVSSRYVTYEPCEVTVVVNNVVYYHCDSTWYSRGYEGGEVVYIITSAPAGY